MAAWSAVLALSGFHYHGARAAVTVAPRVSQPRFQCFWSTATGRGTFTRVAAGGKTQLSLRVLAGTLPCQSCEIRAAGRSSDARVNGKAVAHRLERRSDRVVAGFAELLTLKEHDELSLEVGA